MKLISMEILFCSCLEAAVATSYMIPALERTFAVIDYISKAPKGVSFSDIVKDLDAPKASIFRILHTLENYSWIEKTGDRYRLSYMFIHYGMLILSRRDLAKVARPHLQRLMEDLGETAHLAVLSGKKSMLMAVCESTNHIKLSSPVGTLLPLNCTSHGKIFLTYSVDEPLETFLDGVELVRNTSRSIVTIEGLKEETERIRKRGYSLDDLEVFDDVRCCAAPVFDGDGRCIAAVGITATRVRFPSSLIEEISQKVRSTAAEVSREMGY